MTLFGDTVYAFDNVFDKIFGVYGSPEIQAQETLDWFTKLGKCRFYSMIWFNETLRIPGAKAVAKQVGVRLEPI